MLHHRLLLTAQLVHLTKGTAMTAVTPTATGGPITGWSVSPSLPSGLSLDSSTGEILGTPDAVTSSAIYTITATNTGGSATADVTIVVNDVAPSSLAYSPSSFTLTKGTAMTAVTPTAKADQSLAVRYHLHSHQVFHLIHRLVRSAERQILSHLLQFTPLQQQMEVAPPLTSPLSSTMLHHRLFLQPKFVHFNQGYGNDCRHSNRKWRARC